MPVKAKSKRRDFQGTTVSVAKSREQISAVLQRWGAQAIQWDDILQTGESQLRFKWAASHRYGVSLGYTTAKIRLPVKLTEAEERKITLTPARAREAKRQSLLEAESRRIHRVALAWLKAQVAAAESGLFGEDSRQRLVLAFIEDIDGTTVGDMMIPQLHALSKVSMKLALANRS